MDGWVGGWMGEWMDGWMGEWMDGWMVEWMDGWMDGWVTGWMDGWMDEQGFYIKRDSTLQPNKFYSGNCPTDKQPDDVCIRFFHSSLLKVTKNRPQSKHLSQGSG